MDFSRLCINCMKEKEPEQNICPHCHFDQSTYVMPPYVLTPYTVLNGRYLVGKVLGKGGFGITYIAMDMMLERVVAIKEFFVQGYMYRDNSTSTSISVSTSAGDSQEQYYRLNREKFEREAKIIAHLDDLTGIVKVYDFFYENDTVYMVLEYLDGINLKEYVKAQGGKLNVNEVTSKLNSVMSSLQNLHEHGILHRDISPDNIMVLGDGSLKLLDFGGAKIQANTGLSNMVIARRDIHLLSSIIQTETRAYGPMSMRWQQPSISASQARFRRNPSSVWRKIPSKNLQSLGYPCQRNRKRFF